MSSHRSSHASLQALSRALRQRLARIRNALLLTLSVSAVACIPQVHAQPRFVQVADDAAGGWQVSTPVEATELCDGLAELGIGVACQASLDRAGWTMVAHFEDKRQLERYGDALSGRLIPQFCRSAARDGGASRFFLELHGAGHWLYDCQRAAWSPWIRATTSRAPAQRRADPSPRELCATVQADRTLPVGCSVTRSNGLPVMTIGFRSFSEAERYWPVVGARMAAPFCAAGQLAGSRSMVQLFVQTAQSTRVFDCESGELSPWRVLEQPAAAQQRRRQLPATTYTGLEF